MAGRALAALCALAAAAGAPQGGRLRAVSSFGLVTTEQTTERFFGPGMPAGYAQHVPAVHDLVQRYLAASQTVDFCSASGEGRLGCDLGAQKLVVLPETTLPTGAEGAAEGLGKTLVDYALGGGSVVVAGGALLFDADGAARGSFASPLGSALGLDWSRTHAASSLAGASVNVSRTANPEWWRLLTVDATMLGTTSPLQAVAPAGPDTLTLATVTLRRGGDALPLLTAKRMGERGWLVYAASSEAALIEAAVDFILAVRFTPLQPQFSPSHSTVPPPCPSVFTLHPPSMLPPLTLPPSAQATGVFLNPGAGALKAHSPVALTSSTTCSSKQHAPCTPCWTPSGFNSSMAVCPPPEVSSNGVVSAGKSRL